MRKQRSQEDSAGSRMDARPSAPRRILFAALTLSGGLLAALLLAEIGLRLFAPQQTGPVQYDWNPELGQVQVPHQHARRTVPGVFSYTYTNNSLGLRGTREYPAGRRPGHRRVLFLGDSFTYGVGVNDDETFAALTERSLDSSGTPTEVVNAGVGGTGTDYALNFFLKVGRTWEPSVVALFFYWNDIGDNARHSFVLVDGLPQGTAENPVKAKQFTRSIPGYEWLVTRSHLANLVKQAAIRWIAVRDAGGADISPPADRLPRTASPAEREETAALLHTLRREVEKTGAEFLLFYIPTEGEVEQRRRGAPPSATETFVAEAGGPVFHSFTEVLAAAPHAAGELYFAERHWTPAAHRIAAGLLADLLRVPAAVKP